MKITGSPAILSDPFFRKKDVQDSDSGTTFETFNLGGLAAGQPPSLKAFSLYSFPSQSYIRLFLFDT